MTHAQQFEGSKSRNIVKDNKPTRKRNYEYFQQKSGCGNHSEIQQKS